MEKPSLTSSVLARLTRHRRWLISIGVILVLTVAVMALTAPQSSGKSLLTLATSHQSEQLTELSLNAVQYLPKQVDAGQTASFSFNIANHETATKTYAAVITLVENGKARTIEHDNIVVPSGDSRNTTVRFSTPTAGTNLEVIVSLPSENLQVRFRSHS